jgi:hypothetical protein
MVESEDRRLTSLNIGMPSFELVIGEISQVLQRINTKQSTKNIIYLNQIKGINRIE